MGNNKKRKAAATVGAVTLVAALVLTGTYAWKSISQTARNENTVYANPGGRLHDDWNGKDARAGIKRVYVENFTGKDKAGDEDNDAAPIYVRVKLQTYMEFGEEAGVTQKETAPGSGTYTDMNQGELDQRNVKTLVSGANINKPETWPVYIHGEDSAFQKYIEMKTDLQTQVDYMPTFNKNKESLMADINGTYAKKFADYVDYSTTTTATQKEYWYKEGAGNAAGTITAATVPGTDADYEEVGDGTTTQVHTAAKTQTTEKIISMETWLGYDGTTAGQEKSGKYWVYDEDGWAYWAQPLKPQTATGPLLTNVNLKASIGENCYYAINVIGEFASAGDWGNKNGVTDKELGFYKNKISENAVKLLDTIADTVGADWVQITTSPAGDTATNSTTVEPGQTITLDGEVTLQGSAIAEQGITWAIDTSVTGATLSGTRLTQAGNTATLTIDQNEPVKTIKITATPKANPDAKVTYKVKIAKPEKVTVTTSDRTENVRANAVVNFTKSVLRKDGNAYSNDAVTWSVSGSQSPTSATIVDTSGKLTIGSDEVEGTVLTVVATSDADPSVSGSAKVTVHPLAETELQKIDAVNVNDDGVLDPSTGATDEITIDGKLFYVLAKKDGKALVLKKSIENQTRAFGATPKWETATLRGYLNGEYLDNNPTLKKLAVSTKLKTWSAWDAANTFTNITETEDKVFCLSEADMFETTNGQTAPAEHYMLRKDGDTVGIKLTAPNNDWKSSWEPTGNSAPNQPAGYWLRSPRTSATSVAGYYGNGNLGNGSSTSTGNGVRPALWISL